MYGLAILKILNNTVNVNNATFVFSIGFTKINFRTKEILRFFLYVAFFGTGLQTVSRIKAF